MPTPKRLLLIALALALALLAQWGLETQALGWEGAVLYVVACGLFLWGVEPRPQEKDESPLPPLKDRRIWVLGGAGLAAGMTAGALFWRNWSNPLAIALWLGSILCFGAAAFLADRSAPARSSPPRDIPRRWEWLLVTLIVLVALAVRAYRVDLYPNGCQSDEGNNGLDALRWLRGEPYTPFASTNEGQATFFTYVIALFFRVFGVGVPTMRLTSAVAGATTVFAFYFLARELYGARSALVGTALLAFSRWHITFSRIVYEAILAPLFEILAFYFLLRGLRERRWRDLVLAGMAVGAGLHTYTAFRVIPLVVVAFLAALALVAWKEVRQTWPGLLAALGGAALVVNPLGLYALRHPQQFTGRMVHISVMHEVQTAGNWGPIWSNVRKTLQMFHYKGDMAALHNLPGAPMLDVWVGALVVLGLAYAFWQWRRREHLLYFFWAVGVLALGILSAAHEAPTARRTIGLIPLLYLLATAALERVWHTFKVTAPGRVQHLLAGILAVATVITGAGNVHTYFVVQAVHPAAWAALSPSESAIGKYLASLEGSQRVFLAQGFQRHSAIHLIAQDPEYTVLNLAQHLPIREFDGRDALFILDPVGEKVLPLFSRIYPQAEVQFHRDRYGFPLFLSVRVPAGQIVEVQGLTGRYYANAVWEGEPRLTRRDAQIAFDWSHSAPLEPPFSVRWEGALLIPGYGDYTFEVQAPGSMTLKLDGVGVVRTENGVGVGRQPLIGGFHDLEVTAVIEEASGPVYVALSGPGMGGGPVLPGYLYNLKVPSHGLVGYYRRGVAWDGPSQVIQIDWFIIPNDILPAPFSIEWRGKIRAPASGFYAFGTNSDDGSLVYINGQRVVDNGGSHGLQYREGYIQLESGYHDIVVQYFQETGSRQMELWWTPPGGPHEIVPLEVLWTGLGEPSEGVAQVSASGRATPLPPVSDRAPAAPVPSSAPLRVEFEAILGGPGAKPGQFREPRGVAVDAAGNIYVADTGNQQVQKFAPDGELLLVFGEEAKLTEPFDLAVGEDGHVFVLDSQKGLAHFGPDGRFRGWVEIGITLYNPRGLGVDGQGNLYVADTGGSKVLKLAPTGEVLAQVCPPGDGAGGVRQPTDAAVAADGTIYVVDPSLRLVQRLDAGGRYLSSWSIPGANTVDSPHLAVLPSGVVLLTEPEGRRVFAYDPEGRLVAWWGEVGEGPGQFAKPVGIAVDREGRRVVVSDPLNHRVQIFHMGK
ncbi:MAG: PA14 domain-containing protein [Anaerolineae bacterium]